MSEDAKYADEFTVSPEELDENGHVNNVVYVRWMQEVAIRHSESTGGTRLAREAGGHWVVRSHRIEYLIAATEGERIEAVTWVESFRRVRSIRQYRFLRAKDVALLAKGETDWVFVDSQSGKPRAIPTAVANAFPVVQNHRRSK